jgi:hypothetical protein
MRIQRATMPIILMKRAPIIMNFGPKRRGKIIVAAADDVAIL